MTDTNTSTKNRRTDLEIQEAVSFALQHIELGMSRTTVQQMLCSKFGYPMKTARRDYLQAMDEYGSAGAARSPRDNHIEQEPSAIAREAYFAKHSCDLQR
jgi:hypothetical protein